MIDATSRRSPGRDTDIPSDGVSAYRAPVPRAGAGCRNAPGAFALAALTSLAIAGCSGTSNAPSEGASVGDAFASRALAVCASAQKSKDGWAAFPGKDFNPTRPDAKQFPEVGAWLDQEVAPTFDAWRHDLTALRTPPTGQQEWARVLTAVGKIADLNTIQVRAAQADSVGEFTNATKGFEDAQRELERATKAAGVAKCADVHGK